MRMSQIKLIDSVSNVNVASSPVDISQIFKMSAQLVIGSGTGTSSTQMQVSNDFNPSDAANATWSNLGSALTSSGFVSPVDLCSRALRAVMTDTFANVTTFSTVADVVDSLNSKYCLASSTTGNFYFWFSNGTGVDPAIAGRTGIAVTFVTDDTADTIASNMRTAAAAHGWTVSGATNQVILTNSSTGPSAIGAVGDSGFTVANTQPTTQVTLTLICQGV